MSIEVRQTIASLRILIAEDDPDQADGLQDLVQESFVDADVRLVTRTDEALELLQSFVPDVFISDYAMSPYSVIELLDRYERLDDSMQVIIVTAYENLVGTRRGIFRVIVKPDWELLIPTIHEALAQPAGLHAGREIERMVNSVARQYGSLSGILSRAWHFSESEVPLLLVGDGAETVAKLIHCLSSRGLRPFVGMHSAGQLSPISSTLELADQGTLYVDGLEDLSTEELVRLLEVVSGQAQSSGAPTTRDVRLMFSSDRYVDTLQGSLIFQCIGRFLINCSIVDSRLSLSDIVVLQSVSAEAFQIRRVRRQS